MTVSVRSGLSVGLAAGLVAAATFPALTTPAPAPAAPRVASISVDLTASVTAAVAGVTTSPGDVIINGYNAIQPWVDYGVTLVTWGLNYLPWPVSLLAPQANIVYSGWQPLAQSVVYSLAYLVDGQFDLIGPILTNGVQTGINNLVQGEIQWVLSFLPPLPPLPSLPFAASVAPRTAGARVAAAARVAAPVRAPRKAAAATVTASRQAAKSAGATRVKPAAAATRRAA